jgi:hypothetical protein
MRSRWKSRRESSLTGASAGRAQESAKSSQGQLLDPSAGPPGHKAPARIPQIQDDAVANDLVRRVMKAIDDWSHANGADAVPRHIIFEQALSILNAIDRNLPARD